MTFLECPKCGGLLRNQNEISSPNLVVNSIKLSATKDDILMCDDCKSRFVLKLEEVEK